MFKFFHHVEPEAANSSDFCDFAFMAVHQLDKAKIILANSANLHSVEEIKKSIAHAVEEIDTLFAAAKKASAKAQGVSDADTD